MKVARMARASGRDCTPHLSGGGLGYLYMMHFVSALANACPHHEFEGSRTNVQFECKTSAPSVVDGKVKVRTGPGLGVYIDVNYIKKHRLMEA